MHLDIIVKNIKFEAHSYRLQFEKTLPQVVLEKLSFSLKVLENSQTKAPCWNPLVTKF